MIADLMPARGDLLYHIGVRLHPHAAQKKRRLDPVTIERIENEPRFVRAPRRVDRQRDR